MRKPQPFFLQVSPPKAWTELWLHLGSTRSVVALGTGAASLALLSHHGHSNPAALQPWHHLSPSPTSQGGSWFPWFHKSPTATGIWVLPLLSDEDQLSCRTRAVLAHSTTPAEEPSLRKSAFSQKSCCSRHSTGTPPHLSAHTPGVGTFSCGNGLFQLETGHLELPGKRFGSQEAVCWARQQNYPVSMTIWAVQVSLPADITSGIPGERADPWSRARHRTKATCQAWDHLGLEWFWITGIRHFSADFWKVM